MESTNLRAVRFSAEEQAIIAAEFNRATHVEYDEDWDRYKAWCNDVTLSRRELPSLPESGEVTISVNLACNGERVYVEDLAELYCSWDELEDEFTVDPATLENIFKLVGRSVSADEFTNPNEGIWNWADFYPC